MTGKFFRSLPAGWVGVCLAASVMTHAQQTSPVSTSTKSGHEARRSATAPDAEDKERFGNLLKRSRTGIVKLLNVDCPNAQSRLLISANSECLNDVNGGGGSFSFRDREYSLALAADVRLTKGHLVAGGLFTLGAIVDIGEADISEVGLNTPGINFLDSYQPRTTESEVAKESAALNERRSNGRFVFGGAAPLVTGHVYGLRSIAYRSADARVSGKREDVLILMTVARIDEDGNATLVWKELWRRQAPLLDITK